MSHNELYPRPLSLPVLTLFQKLSLFNYTTLGGSKVWELGVSYFDSFHFHHSMAIYLSIAIFKRYNKTILILLLSLFTLMHMKKILQMQKKILYRSGIMWDFDLWWFGSLNLGLPLFIRWHRLFIFNFSSSASILLFMVLIILNASRASTVRKW